MTPRVACRGFVMLLLLSATAGTAAAQARGGRGSAGAPARTAPAAQMDRRGGAPAARPPAMASQPPANRPVASSSQIVRRPDRHVIVATPPYFGLYGGYYNGFYNGFYDPYPYLSGSPFYPASPYASTYVEQSYVAPSPSQSEVQLSYEVERLTREVERLREDQAEVALRQLQPPPAPRLPEPPPTPITLVFRDGRRLTIQSYAVVRQTLWVVDERNSMRIDISELDLPATQQANLGRVLLLPVPAQ